MRAVIAGSGDLSRYICEEFTKVGHEVIILTRKLKPQFELPGVSQFITDYTEASLRIPIDDGDVLISTISDCTRAYIDVHRSLIEACKQSVRCRRFIPSEFAGDVSLYPDQPGFYYRTRQPIRKMLEEQKGLEWTLICVGWLIDYIVPAKNRYLKDIGDAVPINLANSSMLIPGTGEEPVDATWARDVAKGLASLIDSPSGTWDRYTYMSGERTCWNDVARAVQQQYDQNFTTERRSLHDLYQENHTHQNEESKLILEQQIFSASQASGLPPGKVQDHRELYFSGVCFRTVQDGFAELDRDVDMIL
ncbi:hypothetical protein B0J13DRAFT_569449 [Dactylonectria estremocensis]|uniref:NmrA-like domain-containing protein n=1 Tax=Dactylonectria estremocensis TaxID=1079267 RepID=A0A9P9DDR1_9HYPO|nr:hypothetical protein B0J13DRAFT_569449 [Dactylonectria estremocensis]